MSGFVLRKISIYLMIAGIVIGFIVGIVLGDYPPQFEGIQEPHPLRWFFAFMVAGIFGIISSVLYAGAVVAETITDTFNGEEIKDPTEKDLT
ncbi:hypothetical protein [Pseudalkalibacillus caeni]|uniref:Uncharacterized protein n=1 Tax=Exobacillus caeni TaxID=2574798 RepID=A0A5R9F9Q4_9BACL|nr:hypothetical protein [Pseudalkalibacillus caeni]TLS38970.1 hypothetical protein FCL54_01265 [Pseudalkalibacillus caeni]